MSVWSTETPHSCTRGERSLAPGLLGYVNGPLDTAMNDLNDALAQVKSSIMD